MRAGSGQEFGDEPRLQAAVLQRLEQRSGRHENSVLPPPDLVLALDETVAILDFKLGKQILVGPEPVRVAEQKPAPARGELRVVAPERGSVTGDDEFVVPVELDERVVPVEENRLEHAR